MTWKVQPWSLWTLHGLVDSWTFHKFSWLTALPLSHNFIHGVDPPDRRKTQMPKPCSPECLAMRCRQSQSPSGPPQEILANGEQQDPASSGVTPRSQRRWGARRWLQNFRGSAKTPSTTGSTLAWLFCAGCNRCELVSLLTGRFHYLQFH